MLFKNKILLTLILLGVVLRMLHLFQPFGGVQGWNAGHYSILAMNYDKYGWLTPVSYENILHFSVPPMYSWILRCFFFLGQNEVVARLPSLLFGIATIGIVYLLAKEIYPKQKFLITAIFALMPIHVALSQKVLVDVVMLFFMVASGCFFLRYYKYEKITDVLICGLLLGIGIMVKQPAAGLFIVYAIMLRGRVFCRAVIVGFVIALLPFLLFGLVQPDIFSSMFSEGGELHWHLIESVITLVYSISPLVFFSAMFLKKCNDWKVKFFIMWMVVYGFYFLFEAPSGHIHYVLPLVVPFAFFAGFVSKKMPRIFLPLLIITLVANAWFVSEVVNFNDARYKEMGDYLIPMLADDDNVSMIESGGAPLVAYYLNRSVINPERGQIPDFIFNERKPIVYYSDKSSVDNLTGYVISRKKFNMTLLKSFSSDVHVLFFSPYVSKLYVYWSG
jgi:4-amino-4-deoxy-L-arabinose transferase-like glycosyltransferase